MFINENLCGFRETLKNVSKLYRWSEAIVYQTPGLCSTWPRIP